MPWQAEHFKNDAIFLISTKIPFLFSRKAFFSCIVSIFYQSQSHAKLLRFNSNKSADAFGTSYEVIKRLPHEVTACHISISGRSKCIHLSISISILNAYLCERLRLITELHRQCINATK